MSKFHRGDIVKIIATERGEYWNKDGHMDKYIGMLARVSGTDDKRTDEGFLVWDEHNNTYWSFRDDDAELVFDNAWEIAKSLVLDFSEDELAEAFPDEWNEDGMFAIMSLSPGEVEERLEEYMNTRRQFGDILYSETAKREVMFVCWHKNSKRDFKAVDLKNHTTADWLDIRYFEPTGQKAKVVIE